MIVTRELFDIAVEAIWAEIEYQNQLPRRTEHDEAQDVPGFLTLGRVYLARAEASWAGHKGPVTPAHDDLRKLAAIFARAMIYCGVLSRRNDPPASHLTNH